MTDSPGCTDDVAYASTTTTASPQPGPTLLPATVARAVSLATRSTSLAIRVGSLFGSYGLDAAKFTTLSSLELARGMVEGVLVRAGRDNLLRPRSDFATADAETILERSLESLHHAATQAVFWTSTSFQLTGTTLFAASEFSQLLLSSLDQLFGSTDSSRAIASIVTLIRREFNNPATGNAGEKVGVVDLILALSALAYLQQRCRKSLEDERRTQAQEEVIWDVVVVDDGRRVDVFDKGLRSDNHVDQHGELQARSPGAQTGSDSMRPVSLHQGALDTLADDDQVLARLRSQIASSLSPGAAVSISSSVLTTQTITVDISGPQNVSLPTPPGAEIVETTMGDRQSQKTADPGAGSSYRVVYRIHRDKFRSTAFQRQDEPDSTVVELEGHDPRPQPSRDPEETPQATSRSTSPVLADPRQVREDRAVPASRGAKKLPPTPPQTTRPRQQRRAPTPNNVPKRTSSAHPPSPVDTKPSAETTANQKKPRTPLTKPTSRSNLRRARHETSNESKKPQGKRKTESAEEKGNERKSGFKQALKGSGQTISNMWSKDTDDPGGPSKPARPQWKTAGGSVNAGPSKQKGQASRTSNKQTDPQPPPRSYLSLDPKTMPRSPSRASYVSIHDRRRDSVVSQADSYSVRLSGEMRPESPTVMRTEVTAHESLSRQANENPQSAPPPPSFGGHHRRGGSYVPSLYSLATNDSQTSLVLSSYYQKSAYNASDALSTLRRAGAVEGTFPAAPLLQNISRYMRFSSASYGSKFLKLMGISNNMPSLQSGDETHHDVRHFLHHTDSGEGSILLASIVDPGGGSDSSGSTESGLPLVHYISLDHEAKAVVLACRGTLGFEDVLTDLACEYDGLTWRGRSYRVHKGIHASSRRILYGGDGRVLVTLQEALREFPDYGLVLCGHSLGGAVTSLLGVMLSEPNPSGTGFVTASEAHFRQLTDGTGKDAKLSHVSLPSGRPIHVFAYGPPGAMSVSLCKITKGLITTIIHGSDLVPHLSLGLLHDFQALALTFKEDERQAKVELRKRMWQAFQSNVAGRFYGQSPTTLPWDEEDWMVPTLGSLRESMKSEKLMPPGEVFCIESQRVLRRDAFLLAEEQHIGRPAQRIVLRYVKDVQARFREVAFGTSMLIDHSPAKYEAALNKLRLGVAE